MLLQAQDLFEKLIHSVF